MDIIGWWANLSQPQADLLAACMNFLGALTGTLLAPAVLWLLQRPKLRSLDEGLAAVQQSVKKQEADVADLEAEVDANVSEGAQRKKELKKLWYGIRDKLDQIAADPQIDGRTRAKYARIDRRSYGELIQQLDGDRRLGDLTEQYTQAAKLWLANRPRNEVSIDDVVTMRGFANKVGLQV